MLGNEDENKEKQNRISNLYVVINELKHNYSFNMATIKQLENNSNKAPRKKQFVYQNQRIIDFMNRHGKGLYFR